MFENKFYCKKYTERFLYGARECIIDALDEDQIPYTIKGHLDAETRNVCEPC